MRKWRAGDYSSVSDFSRLALLVAFVDVLENDHLISDPASWLDTSLGRSSFTGIDILVEDGSLYLMQYAGDSISAEEVLDSVLPVWRNTLDERFEVYEAEDGERAIRARFGDLTG